MSLFKPKPVAKMMFMPEGYTFEFEVETNIPHTFKDWPDLCEVNYRLFYNGEFCTEGRMNYYMNQPHLGEHIFMFARKKSLEDLKKRQFEEAFEFQSTGTYVFEKSMLISPEVRAQHGEE